MCGKHNAIKRLFLIVQVPAKQEPRIVGVIKQYPLFQQMFEETKNRDLTKKEVEQLGLSTKEEGRIRLYDLSIPIHQLY